jgi:hypothetical protein
MTVQDTFPGNKHINCGGMSKKMSGFQPFITQALKQRIAISCCANSSSAALSPLGNLKFLVPTAARINIGWSRWCSSTTRAGSSSSSCQIGIEITSIDQVIECLQHHHDRIEHWKSTQPTHQDLTTATININALINFLKNTHHQEHLSLKEKVKVLEDALSKMETELTDLKKEQSHNKQQITDLKKEQSHNKQHITDLTKELSRNKQLFMLHDLNRIFRYYIAESKIGSWVAFVENVVTMKAKFEDNEITEEEFENFILPLNTSLGFDVATLIEFIQDRHTTGHSDVRSAKNQQQFLITCMATHFDDDLKPFVDEIIRQLSSSSISYHRMC